MISILFLRREYGAIGTGDGGARQYQGHKCRGEDTPVHVGPAGLLHGHSPIGLRLAFVHRARAEQVS